MFYKVTISDVATLQECIEFVSFRVKSPPDDYKGKAYPLGSMIIEGKIGTDEKTVPLYKWASIPSTDPDCYKEITVEQTHADQLIRKVTFSKAFVVDYSESHTDKTGIGYFSLYVRQFAGVDIECSDGNETVKIEKKKEVKDNGSVKPILTVVNYGDQFTKKARQTVLKPNTQYTSPEGYTYKTDSLGRITSAEGTLQLGAAKRKKDAQRRVGGKDRLPDDEGGHLIASIFKGSGNYDNLVPMNGNLNKGEWKKLENSWTKALNSKPPKQVQVKVTPIYRGDSLRPDYFILEYKVGTKHWNRKKFKNTPGGK
ncbi:MAG TPA: DNA/RNA non-specific endonuclease [Clostridia bacterium]